MKPLHKSIKNICSKIQLATLYLITYATLIIDKVSQNAKQSIRRPILEVFKLTSE